MHILDIPLDQHLYVSFYGGAEGNISSNNLVPTSRPLIGPISDSSDISTSFFLLLGWSGGRYAHSPVGNIFSALLGAFFCDRDGFLRFPWKIFPIHSLKPGWGSLLAWVRPATAPLTRTFKDTNFCPFASNSCQSVERDLCSDQTTRVHSSTDTCMATYKNLEMPLLWKPLLTVEAEAIEWFVTLVTQHVLPVDRFTFKLFPIDVKLIRLA